MDCPAGAVTEVGADGLETAVFYQNLSGFLIAVYICVNKFLHTVLYAYYVRGEIYWDG